MAEQHPEALTFTLLSRHECPLCDEFQAAFERWRAGRTDVRLRIVDIDTNQDLHARYVWRIPLLLHGERELCAGHFDAAAVHAVVPPATAERRGD